MTQILIAESDEMVQLVHDTGAFIHDGSFKLSSGKPSTYYFDSKLLTMDPEGGYKVGKYFFGKLRDSDAEAVGGMALGAIPIVEAVTLISHMKERPFPGFFVRKEAKAHGTQNLIEGNFPADPNVPVAILDDVVTGGGSIMQAIEAVEAKGNPIVSVMCILDRDEGGREFLKKRGYDLQAMYVVEDGKPQYNP